MPAAAVPIIAGVAAGAAAATVVTVSTAIAIGMAVASAVMMLSVKTPSLGDYKSASERGQVLRNAAAAKTLCYGRVVSSGLMVFVEEQPGEQEEGEWLHMLLLIAGHPIERIGTVYVGERTAAEYGGLVSYELINDPASANPHLLANCPSWKSDMIGRGMASFRISLKSDFEKFPSGLPNIRVEKFGSRVYDPRDGKTKWSANAALCILDYYRTWLHIPDDEINFDEFKVAANICDEIVSNGDGSTELRYQVHGEFDLTEPRAKVLEAMHMACAGQPTYVGGRHGLIVGAYYGPATDELHDHQIIDDLELLPEPPTQDKINTITGTFVDASAFKEADFPAVSVAQWIEEDGGQELAEDITLRCVTSPWQAQRLANIMLRQRRTSRTITCSVNLSGWRYRPGSYLRLYIPALGIDGVEFRVVDWAFNLTGGVQLTLREESAAVWADAIGKPMQRPDITNLPSGGVAAPDNLRYEVDQIEDVVQGVLLWSNSSQTVYNQVVIQSVVEGKASTVHTAQCPGQRCRLAGLPAGSYLAQVRAVAANGAQSPIVAVAFNVVAPVAPLGYDVESGNWALAIRPRFSTTHISVMCEWWWSVAPVELDKVTTAATYGGIASYLTLQGLQPDADYYWYARAVNAYGHSELVSGTGRTSYDPASILDILDGQIGADKLRPELREPIESIDSIQSSVVGIGQALDELDRREQSVNDRLTHAQDALGENYVNVTLIQEMLRKRIDQYKGDFEDFRDAVFAVDPGTGEITMDAVNAVRTELGAEITAVSMHLNAVEAIVNTCVTRAELEGDLERITVVEQEIDGIKGTLTQTATKSEVDELGSKVTQVSQGLDATNAALTQKAAQSAVDAQGQRLAAAEQKISANTSATEATAQRIDRISAELQLADQVISASITALAETVATETEALARRLTGMEAAVDGHSSAISELQEVISGDGQSMAGRFDNIKAELDLTAEGSIADALATAAESTRQRLASGQIRRDQQVIVDAQQALARVIEEVRADYQAADADLGASVTSVREALATETEALAKLITQVRADYQSADDDAAKATSAAIQAEQTARATADEALSRRVDTVQATAAGNTSAIQTVAQATANISGQVEAGWYTKAQINGAGGGFGLSVQLNSDGSTLTSFVVDADVFAVLSRATGVTSQRHPFVVKNGTVYLNHALMETAEITNLIASAIKTVTLSAITIDNSVFKGGAAAFGRGGPHVAFGETWHTTISSDGTIATNRLVASAGEFSGTIKANAGEMSNVTIKENCEVMGTVYADRIVGDIVRVYALVANTTHDLGSAKFLRTLVISGVANSTVSASASLSVALNGSSVFAVGASPSTQRTVLASQTVWSNGNISIPSHSHSTPSGYTGSTSIYGVSGSSHSHSISGSSTGSGGGYSSSISVSGSTNPMSVEVGIATSASNIAAVTLHAGVNYTLVTSASIGSGTSATAIGIVCKG